MSKKSRRRALVALSDATGRPFLAAAPLMAIVEAVQVLDWAGLLSDGMTNGPSIVEKLREDLHAEQETNRAFFNDLCDTLDIDDDARTYDDVLRRIATLDAGNKALMADLVESRREKARLARELDDARAGVNLSLAGEPCPECGNALNDIGACTTIQCPRCPF